MGCGSSNTIDKFPGWYKTNLYDFKALNISENDVKKLYKYFQQLDDDKIGSISIDHFFHYHEIKYTNFAQRVFSMYDDTQREFFDARQFIIIMWDFCTLSEHALVHFIFALYDVDGSGDIDREEAQMMIKDMYGDDYETSFEAIQVHRHIGNIKKTKLIDLETFRYFVDSNLSLLNPAKQFQKYLQSTILGETFWIRYVKKRTIMSGSRNYISAKSILKKYGNHLVIKLPQHWQAQYESENGIRPCRTESLDDNTARSKRKGSRVGLIPICKDDFEKSGELAGLLEMKKKVETTDPHELDLSSLQKPKMKKSGSQLIASSEVKGILKREGSSKSIGSIENTSTPKKSAKLNRSKSMFASGASANNVAAAAAAKVAADLHDELKYEVKWKPINRKASADDE